MELILLLIVGAIVYAVVRATIHTKKFEADLFAQDALKGEESIYDENRKPRHPPVSK